MSTFNEFHAREIDVSEQRPASDVFKSAATSEVAMSSRFASSGKYTTEQLEAGVDQAAPAEEPDFDPEDKRSLYDRLQAQKDAKQEDFEHRNAFKNQMDHWKLDVDDAAFEEERRQKQIEQQAEAARLHQEGAEFYRLARAAQETVAKPVSVAPPARSVWEGRARAEKRKPAVKPAMALKVIKTGPQSSVSSGAPGSNVGGGGGGGSDGRAAAAAKPVAAAAPCGLPGMGGYGSDDVEDEDD